MVYYGQPELAQWLLLTGYRHLQMPNLMALLPILHFLPNKGAELTLIQFACLRTQAYGQPSQVTAGLFVHYLCQQCTAQNIS